MSGDSQEHIASGCGQKSPKDRDLESSNPMSCPGRGEQWAEQRAYSAGAQQDTHSEKCASCGIELVPSDGELVLSHHREQHPARTNDQVAGFYKNCGAQTDLGAHVADAVEDRRKIHQIPPMQWASVFGMRLDETHSQDEESRSQERKRVQDENGIASEQRCYCPAKGRADHQVEGPGGRRQSVRE